MNQMLYMFRGQGLWFSFVSWSFGLIQSLHCVRDLIFALNTNNIQDSEEWVPTTSTTDNGEYESEKKKQMQSEDDTAKSTGSQSGTGLGSLLLMML